MRRPPLRVPGYPRLLASYAVNETGDSVGLIALSILVYGETGSAMATTALFVATKFLPALLAPVLTARVDQLPVNRILPALYAAEALVFLLLTTQVDAFSLPLVLLLGLLDGTLALTGRGVSRGAVARLLEPHAALRQGNALLNVAFGVASVVGLAAGGLLASEATITVALLADAVSFAVIAVLLAVSRDLPAGADPSTREPFRVRLTSGLRYTRSHAAVRSLLVFQALALLFFTLIVPIEVVYARETLGTDAAGFGALLAAWSAGIFAGSLLFLRLARRSPLGVVLLSSTAIGLAYLGLALTRDLGLACAVSVVGGLGNGIQWVAVMTLLQEETPDELQARIAGLLESVAAAVPGIAYLLGGVLVTLASPPVAYAVAGSGVIVAVGLAALALPRLSAQPPPRAPSADA